MKKFLIVCLFFPSLAYCQKIALIDKEFKRPILFTDSITVEQIKSGYFPIATTNMDTFFANVKYIKEILEVRQRAKMESFELRAGGSYIKVSRVPYAYGDRYTATAYNTLNDIQAVANLVNHSTSNKKNVDRLEKFMGYLKTNKAVFAAPYEVHPKMYNVVVIAD